MHVLVAAASKHGSTDEIAGAVGQHLADAGLKVTLAAPADVTDLAGYDAVVLGSAVYAGHWTDPATNLVERLSDQLRFRPVGLFSSGPIGDPPMPKDDAVEVAELVAATQARDHKVLAGQIDKSRLGFAEKAIVRALRVTVGDYRDSDDIAKWSAQIATTLSAAA
jgi:menaquinone-dependent protoporphyrinogen oxidase